MPSLESLIFFLQHRLVMASLMQTSWVNTIRVNRENIKRIETSVLRSSTCVHHYFLSHDFSQQISSLARGRVVLTAVTSRICSISTKHTKYTIRHTVVTSDSVGNRQQ